MLIKSKSELSYADITPRDVYLNRRRFLQGLGFAGAAAVAGERLYSALTPGVAYAGTKLTTVKSGYTVDEKITSMENVTHYNNFYEFGSGKEDPAKNAQKFRTSPWRSPDCRFAVRGESVEWRLHCGPHVFGNCG